MNKNTLLILEMNSLQCWTKLLRLKYTSSSIYMIATEILLAGVVFVGVLVPLE